MKGMNDQELRAKVRKALDNKLSGVNENPWLAQLIINCADEEEPVMKKKLLKESPPPPYIPWLKSAVRQAL